MRESKIGEKNPMFGDKRTKSALKKFSEKMSGENHHYFKKERDSKTKAKISESLKGYKWSEKEKKKRKNGMTLLWKKRKEGKCPDRKPNKNTKHIKYRGVTKTLAEWENITGIKKHTISTRLARGWSIAKALS